MLGFLHRHQKSLMLVLLVPALLAMGITGAVMSVLQYRAQPKAGVVFGESVDQEEFVRLRRVFGSTGGEEAVWQYYAQLKWAEQNGISVSRKEVGETVLPEIEAQINQILMREEMKKRNVDYSTPEGQAAIRQIFDKYINRKVSAKEYEEFFKDRGMSVGDYEAQQVRDQKVLRMKEVIRDLGTVTPEEVWEKFQEDNHLRTASLIELSAEKYAPDLGAKEGDPGYVSADEVKGYYELRRADYNEPRRVDTSYLGLTFEGVEHVLPGIAPQPSMDALVELNRLLEISPVGSESEFEDQLREAYWKRSAKLEVARIMDAVADHVEEAREKKTPADLASIASAVRAELQLSDRIMFEQGRTGLVELEDQSKIDVLEGFAASRWFRLGATDKTSDVLASSAGFYVVQNKAIKTARTPSYDEVKARAREDYARGSKDEQKAYYEGHKNEFKLDPSYAVRWWYMSDQAAGDHDKARQQLEAAVADAKQRNVDLLLDPDVPNGSKLRDGKADEATEKELAKQEIIKAQAKNVPVAVLNQYSRAFEYEGGWAVFKLLKVLPPRYAEYEEVRDEVAKKVALERAVERAEVGARGILSDLSVLQGDALQATLKTKGMSERQTEPFERTATSLEGIEDASRIVAECFSTLATLGGPYFAIVPDAPGRRVFLVRANRRVEAPREGFEQQYSKIRHDLLSKTRLDFQEDVLRNMLLRAKHIPEEQVDYALELMDGPNGEARMTIRQIFLPPDPETIDAHLDAAAREKMAAAQQDLAKGTAWSTVVLKHSEHDATRRLSGALPALSRGELEPEFGTAFVDAAFNLPLNEVSTPIKSNLGLHLVRKIEQRPDGRCVFQHILVRMDPKKAPADVLAKAKAISRQKLEKAKALVEGGKPFGEVAIEYGSDRDPFGRGQELKMSFVTHWERGAFDQYLNLELPESHPDSGKVWVPEAREIKTAKGTSWHLFLAVRPEGMQGGMEDSRFTDRNVFHVEASSKDAIEEVRAAFKKKLQAIVDGDDNWSEKVDAFKDLARDRSTAPSKAKSGGMGLIRLKRDITPMGGAFLEGVCYQPDGKPAVAGYRTDVIESKAGFHLVEVMKVETEEPKGKHRGLVAQQIILGTDWKQ